MKIDETLVDCPSCHIYDSTPPAGAKKPERSGGFVVPLAGLVIRFNQHALPFLHIPLAKALFFQSVLLPEGHRYEFLSTLLGT